MGEIKKILASADLPERERHNSRLFVDLSEQVHIHFREFRNVFSVDEFFEYADTICRSRRDLRTYLRWHPQYREQERFDNLMVALGAEQQTRPLMKSPLPHKSTYFDTRLQIELQAENVIDEIHVHYRDYRLVMSVENFRIFASTIRDALESLEEFLSVHRYNRIEHPFRKEVVQDTYYEARNWGNPDPSKIPFKDRLIAIGYYSGGEKLARIVSNLYDLPGRIRRLLARLLGPSR